MSGLFSSIGLAEILALGSSVTYSCTFIFLRQGLRSGTPLAGVLIMDGPLAGMFSRAVVVLDENNTVVHAEQLERLNNEPDYGAAFRALGIEVE